MHGLRIVSLHAGTQQGPITPLQLDVNIKNEPNQTCVGFIQQTWPLVVEILNKKEFSNALVLKGKVCIYV